MGIRHRKGFPRRLFAVFALFFVAACKGIILDSEDDEIRITNNTQAAMWYKVYTSDAAVISYLGDTIELAETERTPQGRAEWERFIIRPGATVILDTASIEGDYEPDDTLVFHFFTIGEIQATRTEIRTLSPADLKSRSFHVVLTD